MAVFGEIMTNMKKTYNYGEKVEGKKREGRCPHQPKNMSPTTIAASTTHCHARGWWVWTLVFAWGLVSSIFVSSFFFFSFFLINTILLFIFYTKYKFSFNLMQVYVCEIHA